ncbi:hypothetical protein GCM10011482_19290 [Enterococcus alcedinis]|uniref:N-acetyltransferase domain-containing protein n=2 Tax=Enterococcus alcedinis TaxID=1274384 RepID=A0A917N4X9_9ENTE|nr:GNAT family N-acetyltransferase [Enterococcus alcedinis]MBP2102715.1 GNAT superfamily N-acetyltransferase [Enterococcus alcedinis]GGI66275.1 hypothetical protein GCM10011482_19290 [Enterococcus alcedinis]
MKALFKKYTDLDYHTVCEFLIKLSKEDDKHINWNWARWEWMSFHPEFDTNLTEKIGLWFSDSELVGMTTYDHYFGEAFYAVKKGYEMLEREILQYAVDNFSDVNGLGIAVNQKDSHTLDLLKEYGFEKNDNNENILEKLFEENGFDYTLPVGIRIKELDVNQDLYKQHSVLWHGFENEGDLPLDQTTLDKQSRMLSAPSLNSYLHLVAVNEENDFVAYCGCWYHPQTDYAYVEPVCTIPNYRKKGLGKALVLEALKRSQSAGAEKAYVISDSPFYKNMGFMQHSNYSFYWKK